MNQEDDLTYIERIVHFLKELNNDVKIYDKTFPGKRNFNQFLQSDYPFYCYILRPLYFYIYINTLYPREISE